MTRGLDSVFSRCRCGITTDSRTGKCLTCTRYDSPVPLPPPAGGYTADQVRGFLRSAMRPFASGRQSGLSAWLAHHGVSSSYSRAYEFLRGHSDRPPEAMLRALGLERRYGPRSR